MALSPTPVHPMVGVLAAVLATLCFVSMAQGPGWLHVVLAIAGLALLGVAIAAATATMRGAPGSGWLPSRESGRGPRPRDEDAS